MNDELSFDEEVDLAMAFLLGFTDPGYYHSQALVAAWNDFRPSLRYSSDAPLLWSVTDLHPSVDRFRAQIQLFDEHKAEFPCVVSVEGTPLPVDPNALPKSDTSLPGLDFPAANEAPKLNVENLEIERFPAVNVARFFISRLAPFLHTRLSSRRAALGHNLYTSPGGPPGLLFSVTTVTRGLQVHYTHQYYLNPTYVFGAPTTPVNAYIQPGRWHFGTSHGNGPVTFDLTNVYDVPLLSNAHLNV